MKERVQNALAVDHGPSWSLCVCVYVSCPCYVKFNNIITHVQRINCCIIILLMISSTITVRECVNMHRSESQSMNDKSNDVSSERDSSMCACVSAGSIV